MNWLFLGVNQQPPLATDNHLSWESNPNNTGHFFLKWTPGFVCRIRGWGRIKGYGSVRDKVTWSETRSKDTCVCVCVCVCGVLRRIQQSFIYVPGVQLRCTGPTCYVPILRTKLEKSCRCLRTNCTQRSGWYSNPVPEFFKSASLPLSYRGSPPRLKQPHNKKGTLTHTLHENHTKRLFLLLDSIVLSSSVTFM